MRKNIRYMVQWCGGGKLVETAMDVCPGHDAKSWQSGSVVGITTQARWDKEERLQDWLEKGGLMVATSALDTGVDYPEIVYVLHVGMPYGMIDFAQESGRAGRAGEAVDSIILVEEGETRRKGEGERTIDESAMAAFYRGGQLPARGDERISGTGKRRNART
ncbi:hypothetical protein H2201_009152 [Coniosporium apollinis]|uniref:DNA 3'-5' helicase n=1 Tax=Coniosporium apollinis TaxID=61459 RepID=A0ABQ9NEM0_9PEZI|nr:hypothetical protein H2201_009152 [Coniosporium apollinis]